MIAPPYFDAILEACRTNESDVVRTFGHNTHWGYWPDPGAANGTVEDFVAASEAMTRLVCDKAGVGDGLAVLDAGCGFGGTVASMNARFERMTLAGINIDARQIERARQEVVARSGNTIEFVVGDACRLPFPDASFDVVMAVECIFHFSSRVTFMREARRVLKPGGALMISEFVTPGRTLPRVIWRGLTNRRVINGFYGSDAPVPPSFYQRYARRARFTPPVVADVSANTQPTFEFLLSLLPRFPLTEQARDAATRATKVIGDMSRRGWMRYQIFTFRPQAA